MTEQIWTIQLSPNCTVQPLSFKTPQYTCADCGKPRRKRGRNAGRRFNDVCHECALKRYWKKKNAK